MVVCIQTYMKGNYTGSIISPLMSTLKMQELFLISNISLWKFVKKNTDKTVMFLLMQGGKLD